MVPNKLIEALSEGTTIQKEERLKSLIGLDVDIVGTVWNVDRGEIRLAGLHTSCSLIGFDDKRFSAELLSYSRGDDVKVTAKLKAAVFSPALRFTFDLVSISKVGTTFQSRQEAEKKAKSGCFIATACYPDIDSPEVVLLKQFRDDVLVRSSAGRAFVRAYCFISPPIARVIVNRKPLRTAVRRCCVEPAVAIVCWSRRRLRN